MAKVSLDEVKKRKNFYRDNFRWSLKMLYRLLVLISCLIVIDVYFIMNKPKSDFYATDSVGLISQLTPLDKPNMSSEALLPPVAPSDEAKTPKIMNLET